MVDNTLNKDIKKLMKQMEINNLLGYELSGYMKDTQRREIFRKSAKMVARPRTKYIAVDQENSGKFLVQKEADKIAGKGYVWGIKAYGQKGYPKGDIQQVTKEFEEANETLIEGVKQRALKNKLKRMKGV